MTINIVVLAGRLVFDPEVKALQNGTMVANLTIAVDNRVKDSNGTWKNEPCFIRCDCFGDLADVARVMHKGQMVLAEGRLKYREYTNKDGKVVSINSVGLSKLSLAQDGQPVQQDKAKQVINRQEPVRQGATRQDQWGQVRRDDSLPF